MACQRGDIDETRLLLVDSRVNPTSNKNEAIKLACIKGHIDIVRLLLADERVDPGNENNHAIRWACCCGHVDVVRLLLADKRVNPADFYNSAIVLACEYGHVDVVRLLLADSRVNPADYNNRGLAFACMNGHIHMVRLLLADDRVNPAANNNYAIRLAYQNGHVDIVCLLLMDPCTDICHAVSTWPCMVNACSDNESFCTLLALAGFELFRNKWGPLDSNDYNIDMLRHWQTTSYINLYNQDEAFRKGPYGVLLKHRLKVSDLYGCIGLTSRLPAEMIELVLEYIMFDYITCKQL